ncbi:YggL family protein [Psychromonas sp.]|uniref:YggL 50S ribosome-binding family protein n=1 Tax=Psychromonas sp. TaxID=1884585 RepID=UPI0039E4E34F
MKIDQNVKRSRRLRKKLYVNEYTVYGFEVSLNFKEMDESALDPFLDEIVNFAESRNLMIAGGGGIDVFAIFISSSDRYGSATEEDRHALSNWLKEKSLIKDVELGDLVDANYSF